MRHIIFTGIIMVLVTCSASRAEDISLADYLAGFDYAARKEMKISSDDLIDGILEGSIQLVDIRFKEEFDAWHMGFGVSIPLNELPKRFNELKKDKIIVTACPHKDRAIIAMTYLKTKGFRVKYLVDGLVGLAEYLRGDVAKELINSAGRE